MLRTDIRTSQAVLLSEGSWELEQIAGLGQGVEKKPDSFKRHLKKDMA